jgi:hypothetical protein
VLETTAKFLMMVIHRFDARQRNEFESVLTPFESLMSFVKHPRVQLARLSTRVNVEFVRRWSCRGGGGT